MRCPHAHSRHNNSRQLDIHDCQNGAASTLSPGLTGPHDGVHLSFPFKLTADQLIARDPTAFLRMLQRSVASSRTPPMTPFEQSLSDRFDALFGNGAARNPDFGAGAQLATS